MHEALTRHTRTETVPAQPDQDEALWEYVAACPLVGPGPHIWVGTVADYQAGRPHGRWVDAARRVADVERDVASMVARSPTPRLPNQTVPWHVFSTHGFGRYEPGPTAPLYDIVRRANQYREDLRAYRAWARLGGDDPGRLERFYDAYQGRYDRFEEWVVLEVERAGYDRLLDKTVPYAIRLHVEINISSLAHELLATGAATTARDPESNGVFVFRNVDEQSAA